MTTTRTEPARGRATKAARPAAKAAKSQTTTNRRTTAAKSQGPSTNRRTSAAKSQPAGTNRRATARSEPTTATRQTTTRGRKATGPPAVTGTVVSRRPAREAADALERAVRRESRQIELPLLGRVPLPSTEELAYFGGVTAVAVLGLVDWPIAILLAVGHELAANKHRTMLRAFGEALEVA